MEYGYARVSSKEQNLGRQIAAFKAQGIKAQNVYCDKKSGKDFDRIYYKRLVRRMKEGDVLFITELDRLGRNYAEILEQWQYLTKQKKINIVVLDMDLLDTRNTSDLVHTFMVDLVLQILSFVAQKEREANRERQAEGIKIAKENGVVFGRPIKCDQDEFREIYRQYATSGMRVEIICEALNISRSTFYRYVKNYKITR